MRPAPKVRADRSRPLPVEIVSIGRELLRGHVADSNAAFLAGFFSKRGAVVRRITVVDDSERAIGSAVIEALERASELVITSGGLGPAAEDRTLAALAKAFHRPLVHHLRARRMVEDAYHRLRAKGLVTHEGMNLAREKLCSIPVGSEPVPNEVGATPGVLLRLPGGASVLCLPGAPDEAAAVLEAAMPSLRELEHHACLAEREVETPTTDESALRRVLDRLGEEFPSIRIRSHAPGFRSPDARIRVTLEASARTQTEAESAVEGALRRFLDLAGGM